MTTEKNTSDRVQSSAFFQVGDRVQLTGPKGKLNSITLQPGAVFHTHRGAIEHDSLIGISEGSVIKNTVGVQYLALKPLLNDFVMAMPRGAAIIYPKDAAQILNQADIFPGATVLEAGVGSGALSLWLLRAIGHNGFLSSYERREEFADVARANVTHFFGELPRNWKLTVGDFVETVAKIHPAHSVDRVILDMLAPWECLEVAATVLKPGGVFLCYIATVTQLSRVSEAIRASGFFTLPSSSETMVRTWHVDGLAVRPDHRMIGHTGFLVVARRLAEGAVLPEQKRRPSKTEFSEEDVEMWTPGALGERAISPKTLRKRARQAREFSNQHVSSAD